MPIEVKPRSAASYLPMRGAAPAVIVAVVRTVVAAMIRALPAVRLAHASAEPRLRLSAPLVRRPAADQRHLEFEPTIPGFRAGTLAVAST